MNKFSNQRRLWRKAFFLKPLVATTPGIDQNNYYRPGGVDLYRRPGGTDTYIRP